MSYSNISQEPQVVEAYENRNSKIFDHVFSSFNPIGNCIPEPSINMQKDYLFADEKQVNKNIVAEEFLRRRTNNKHVYTQNDQEIFANTVSNYDNTIAHCYDNKIRCLNERKQKKIVEQQQLQTQSTDTTKLQKDIENIDTEIKILSNGLYSKNSLLDDPKQRELSTFSNVFHSLPTDPLLNESCSTLRLGNSSRDIARDVYKKVHCKKQIMPKDRNMFGEQNDGGNYDNESRYKDWLCKKNNHVIKAQ